MTTVSIQTVPAIDLLSLASLPQPQPTMILDMTTIAEIDRRVIREVVAASIPNGRRTSRRADLTSLPKPRPARSHLALNPGGTP